MDYDQPAKLVSFLADLNVDSSREIIHETLENHLPYVSTFYQPQFMVSDVAYAVKKEVDAGKFISLYGIKVPDFIQLVYKISFRSSFPEVYMLLQAVYLEGFSLIYATADKVDLFNRYTKEDATRLHMNINYVIEALQAMNEDFTELIMLLRKLDTDTLYITSLLAIPNGAEIVTNLDEYLNPTGKTNLVKSSDFSDMNNWNLTSGTKLVIRGEKAYSDTFKASHMYNKQVQMSNSATFSFRVEGTGTFRIIATDINGTRLTKFTDYYGNVITNGEIYNSFDKKDPRLVNGYPMPPEVKYVKVELDMPASDTLDNYVYRPILVRGGIIGSYVKGEESYGDLDEV